GSHPPSGDLPGDLDPDPGIPQLDAVARSEDELADLDTVHARSVGAAKIAVDERPTARRQLGMVARHAAVGEDEVIVRRAIDRERGPIELAQALATRRIDDAQAGARGAGSWHGEDHRVARSTGAVDAQGGGCRR